MKLDNEINAHWYTLGETVGVPKDYLDTLVGKEESQCLKSMLEHWLTQHPGQPMWEEVVDAQRKMKLLNHKYNTACLNGICLV